LARAYAMQGDIPEGKAAYRDFLTLWKDADQNLTALIEAKKEFAALH